jgi:integrase
LEAACDRAEFAPSTRRAYARWTCRLLGFSGWPAAEELTGTHVHDFLEQVAREEGPAPATMAQARSALRFFFREVLGRKLRLPPLAGDPRPPAPDVLSDADVQGLIAALPPPYDLMARIIYGCGLLARECLRLRVRDLDLVQRRLCVRTGGRVQRRVDLPEELVPYLWHHLAGIQEQYQRDRAVGAGFATPTGRFPATNPADYRTWSHQYLFPSPRLAMQPTWRRMVRHHIHVTTLYKQLRAAARAVGLPRAATAHTLRHSFAARRLAAGETPEEVQARLGLQHPNSMRIYQHLWE